jgi:DNA polymerase-1
MIVSSVGFMETYNKPSHYGFDDNHMAFINMMDAIAIRDGTGAVLAVDTESTGNKVRDGRDYGTGISVALTLGTGSVYAHYFPVRHIDSTNNLDHPTMECLRRALTNWQGWLVFHNAKFDLVNLTTMGIKYLGKFYDTMLMAHLLNENFPFEKSLNACVKYYVDKEESKKDDIGFKTLVKIKGWGGLTSLEMWAYAEHDARITYKLYQKLIMPFLKEVPQEYWTHKQEFTRVVIKMESWGVRVNTEMSQRMMEIGEQELENIRKELKGFNPGSPDQLQELFISKLGLPVIKLTNAGKKLQNEGKQIDPREYASMDKEALAEYEIMLETEDDPTAQLVLKYRGWQKVVSSNYRVYLEKISPDGRVRPNYKLHGTKTGRMSCYQPNLQQIPRSSAKPWNGNLKQAFIPQDGFSLWEFDYAQLELRFATAVANEETLKDIFAAGRDIFAEMAETLGMVRYDAKTFVYSTQYGAGLDRLMHVFKVSRDRAEEMRNNYYNSYPGFVRMSNKAKSICRMRGKIQLWSGRYRHFWDREGDSHKAFNSYVQGGAADIVEHIMVRLDREIVSEDVRMLLAVHDSTVFEIRNDLVDDVVPEIQRIMEDIKPDFGVRFAVEAKQWAA